MSINLDKSVELRKAAQVLDYSACPYASPLRGWHYNLLQANCSSSYMKKVLITNKVFSRDAVISRMQEA